MKQKSSMSNPEASPGEGAWGRASGGQALAYVDMTVC